MWNPLDTIRTEVLVADRAVVGTDWGRMHDEKSAAGDPFARLYCIESGRANITHHRRRRELRPGGLHIIPANTIVRLDCPRRATISYLHFTATLLGDMDLFSFLDCPHDLRPTNFQHIVARMDDIIQAFNGNGAGKAFEIKGVLLQLLSPFLAASDIAVQNRRRKDIQRFSPVLQYIDANLHRRISLSDLSAMLHLEPTYFSHQFAHTLGLPPMRYVLRRRVGRAQQILWNTDEPLEAVAQQLGFTDAFHFSKTFKRVTGVPPSVYRKRKGLPGP